MPCIWLPSPLRTLEPDGRAGAMPTPTAAAAELHGMHAAGHAVGGGSMASVIGRTWGISDEWMLTGWNMGDESSGDVPPCDDVPWPPTGMRPCPKLNVSRTSSPSAPFSPPVRFFLLGTCGVHSLPSRVHREHGLGWRSSRSHLTLLRLHAAHARLTARMSPSHGTPSRRHRAHGRWSVQPVLARWQFLQAWSLGAPSSPPSPSPSWRLPSSSVAAPSLSWPKSPSESLPASAPKLSLGPLRGLTVGASMLLVA